MTVIFDDRDAEILAARIDRRESISGPRIGDVCIWPGGLTERFSHYWDMDGGEMQTARGGSFYLSDNGGASYSGSLNSAISTRRLELLPETREASFWFFHHDSPGAGRGVEVKAPCRVYRVLPPDGIAHDTPTGWPPGLWEASYFRDAHNCGSYTTPSKEEAERVSTQWYMTGKAGLGDREVKRVNIPE